MGTVSHEVPQMMTRFSPRPQEAGMSGNRFSPLLLPSLYSFLFPSSFGVHAGDDTPTIPCSLLSQQSHHLIQPLAHCFPFYVHSASLVPFLVTSVSLMQHIQHPGSSDLNQLSSVLHSAEPPGTKARASPWLHSIRV